MQDMKGIIERNSPQQGGEQQFDQNQALDEMAANIPPEMQEAFKRVIMAGKRILYGKETQQEVQQFLATEAPVEEKLGAGVANIVIMIDNQAQGNIPKEVIIPAATVLLFDAADFLAQSGESVTVQQMGAAYEIMFYNIFAGYGVPPEQMDAILDEMQGGGGEEGMMPPDQGGQDPAMMQQGAPQPPMMQQGGM